VVIHGSGLGVLFAGSGDEGFEGAGVGERLYAEFGDEAAGEGGIGLVG
jgi:hypothetical protein